VHRHITLAYDSSVVEVAGTIEQFSNTLLADILFVTQLFHRIHRHQHAFTDDAGMSKYRLSPYNAYYHN